MSDNQIISDARGECRHEHTIELSITLNEQVSERAWDEWTESWWWCSECGKCDLFINMLNSNNYSTDLSAWTPELFKWIKDNELMTELQYWLYTYNSCDEEITCVGHSLVIGSVTMGQLIASTSAQKAKALAKAIKESSQG